MKNPLQMPAFRVLLIVAAFIEKQRKITDDKKRHNLADITNSHNFSFLALQCN